jgi:hypothetical protein
MSRFEKTVSMIQDDEEMQKVTPVRLKRELSTLAESSSGDRHVGWLDMPKDGNLKKYGWIARYCILDSDSFTAYADEASAHEGEGAALFTIPVRSMHHCKPIKPEDLIHAKAAVVPRIFTLLAASLGALSTSKEKDKKPSKDMSDTMSMASGVHSFPDALTPRHDGDAANERRVSVSNRAEPNGEDHVHFNGYAFVCSSMQISTHFWIKPRL